MEPDPDQWWNLDGPVELDGQGDMLYGVLGPVLTRHLLVLLDEAVASGFSLSPELKEVRDSLHRADGRSPWLLYQLGLSLAALLAPTHPFLFGRAGPKLIELAEQRSDEILKAAGWFIGERLRSFGFDETTFALNARDEKTWPPRGVACGKEAPSVPRMSPVALERNLGGAAERVMVDLSTSERQLLLDHVPLPSWADDFDQATRRLMALVEAAIGGRSWARPFVRGGGGGQVAFTPDLWGAALGVEPEAARLYAIRIANEMLRGRNQMSWQFDT